MIFFRLFSQPNNKRSDFLSDHYGTNLRTLTPIKITTLNSISDHFSFPHANVINVIIYKYPVRAGLMNM